MLLHRRLGSVQVVNTLESALTTGGDILGHGTDRHGLLGSSSSSSKDSKEHNKDGRIQYAHFGSFDLLHTYVPNHGWKPERHQERCEWDEAIVTFLEQRRNLTERPMIWCGDLNCAHRPDDSTDEAKFRSEWDRDNPIYGGKRERYEAAIPLEERGIPGFADSERRRFDQMLTAGGLVDAWRRLHPVVPDGPAPDRSEPQWTWRGSAALEGGYKARYEGMAQRIDYFLVTEELMKERVTGCDILGHGTDRQGFLGSDHCPMSLRLRGPSEPGPREEEPCNDDVSTDELP